MLNQQPYQISTFSKYRIFRYKSLASSNSFLKNDFPDPQPYTVIWCDQQIEGRGRFQRNWDSIPGEDLTCSILLPLDQLPQQLWPNITQMTAVSVAELLLDLEIESEIKWPNDVLIIRRKICGILTETMRIKKQPCAIIGIGLNTNSKQGSFVRDRKLATSIFEESGIQSDLEHILVLLLTKLKSNFKSLNHSGISDIITKLRGLMRLPKNPVTVKIGNDQFTGKLIMLNDDGSLTIQTSSGKKIKMNSGEIVSGPEI